MTHLKLYKFVDIAPANELHDILLGSEFLVNTAVLPTAGIGRGVRVGPLISVPWASGKLSANECLVG